MRIVFDLDGVICPLKNPYEKYEELKPNFEVVRLLKKLKKEGHVIIIYTSRHMRSFGGNIGKVIAEGSRTVVPWLKKYEIPFDEIYLGKPYADIYIDDKNVVFCSAQQLEETLKTLMPIFVIPMAGRGKRFLEAGYKIPKYLIKIKGETMLEWSLKSLPLDLASLVIFICLTEHEKNYKVSKIIKNIISKKYSFIKNRYLVIFLKKITRGQAETVLKAKKYINNSIPLVIFNIDTYFVSSRLREKILSSKIQGIDGVLGVFYSNNPRLSFVKINKNGFVTKTAEKEKISKLASTGLYTFSCGSDFVEAAQTMIQGRIMVNNEFYIIPVYNLLIRAGKRFIVDFAEECWNLGEPKALNYFLTHYRK